LSFENPHANPHTGMTFSEAEQAGLSGIRHTAFVLVAGGLGERLGYSGIKLSLETNVITKKSYLEIYAKYVQAMQRMARLQMLEQDVKEVDYIRTPLVIMTSDDTDPLTRKLLADNNNFGFDDGQVTIIKQEKVAALSNTNASLSMTSKWSIETKPHGHGDVHHLLYKSGLVAKWRDEGNVKHVIFLQDTNALVINSVLPTLGVSIAKGFHMNSICIPRLAGEAAGAIARLE
jgi:UDP-sugar pyrophosphorylase